MLDFREILRKEREKQGISQRELARKIGCTGRAIGYWEAGTKVPTVDLLDKALKVLGISFIIGKKQNK